MSAFTEQPIGWRVHSAVGIETFATKEEAERGKQRLRFAYGPDFIASVIPVYLSRKERQARHAAAQTSLADLPKQHKTFNPTMRLPEKAPK